jgi:hypothetical protein
MKPWNGREGKAIRAAIPDVFASVRVGAQPGKDKPCARKEKP